jgi:hypothetical protein
MVEAQINAEAISGQITGSSQNQNSIARQCVPKKGGENGDQWDEVLDSFAEGSMNINFYNNMIGYTAGDCVSGTIDIFLQ